jgi:hypothetical protein
MTSHDSIADQSIKNRMASSLLIFSYVSFVNDSEDKLQVMAKHIVWLSKVKMKF